MVYLLARDADVDAQNEEGWSPLHAAVSQGHTNLVKVMVEKYGAKLNIQNENGTTALFHATSAGKYDIVKFLIDKGNRS